ncbi:DUF6714 family protein [Acinetobacter guillouiae]|uniref:DUF6714 family protein n=1 Tax=Acinetobacter guillouiae TaxID=106649 RepID=UPI001CD65D97|nr:DUF6714 family protein [Acinetobacter guillouiae]
MSLETLFNQIKLEFQDVTLGDAYTLPEEDYADTSYWHFDKPHTDLNLTEEEWINQEIHFIDTGSWLPEDRQEAINAIKEKRRMLNRYNDPFEIPCVYLERCATGFSFLVPQAYLFYTPAIMNCVLNDADFNNNVKDPNILFSNSFSSWSSRLKRANSYMLISELLAYFSKRQIELLIDFLTHISLIEGEYDEVANRINDVELANINQSIDNIKLLEFNNA